MFEWSWILCFRKGWNPLGKNTRKGPGPLTESFAEPLKWQRRYWCQIIGSEPRALLNVS